MHKLRIHSQAVLLRISCGTSAESFGQTRRLAHIFYTSVHMQPGHIAQLPRFVRTLSACFTRIFSTAKTSISLFKLSFIHAIHRPYNYNNYIN